MWRLRSWMLILLFSLAGAGLMLWRYPAHRPAALQDGLQSVREAVQPVVAPAEAVVLQPPAKGSMHKCVSPGRALYTDGPCPAGMRPEAVSGGSVTVVKSSPAAPLAASATPAGASQNELRDALLGADAEARARELRDKRMDAVIGR